MTVPLSSAALRIALPAAPAWLREPSRVLPGLGLSVLLAAVAYVLHRLPGFGTFSPLILAILLGIAFHNLVGTPASARPGVAFAMRRLLRLAIVLLGLQLTAAQVVAVGARGIAVIVMALAATLAGTMWLGRALGVDRRLAELIGAGTSICGASAVIAVNTVAEGSEEDVAYAVACVTLFGSLSMFLYPLLPALLGLSAHQYGLWAGASIHEIAQVVAAAFQNGRESGDVATVAKLSRIMLLAPVVLALGALARRRARHGAAGRVQGGVPLPWFVLGFIALIAVNSLGLIAAPVKAVAAPATTFLLTLALAGMGLLTDLRALHAKGLRPLALGAASWVFISALTLAMIRLGL